MPATCNVFYKALPLLALCAGLTSPARAQSPALTYDPINGLYLAYNSNEGYYYDLATGYSYGPDLTTNYAPNPGGTFIVSNSYVTLTQYIYTPVSVTDHTYSTTLDALINGHSVFDMTFALPYSDPAVQAAVAQANTRLGADGAYPSAPSLTASALTDLGSQTTTVQTGETTDGAAGQGFDGQPLGVVTSTTNFGPQIIGPGDSVAMTINGVIADPVLSSPYYFYVRPGQTDVNITDTVTNTIDQTVTTTTTDLLTQRYAITGTPNAAPAVPEPSAFALLALGLLPVGLLSARRKIAP